MAILRMFIHWSSLGQLASGGSKIILMISSQLEMPCIGLNPQQQVFHRAFATEWLRISGNWIPLLDGIVHNLGCLSPSFFACFLLQGEHQPQSSIVAFLLSEALTFHSFLHGSSWEVDVADWLVKSLNVELTKNIPLELGVQMSLSLASCWSEKAREEIGQLGQIWDQMY